MKHDDVAETCSERGERSVGGPARIAQAALRWFDKHQRDLPWRDQRSPYRIWVSEIMLQQTQVATVVPYFRRFVARFPNVGALADAELSTVLRMWEGLGYYRRARQLHQAARLIVQRHRGRCPDDFSDWLALPGIGRYTAGAILSISADQRWPILEANTIRLHSRLHGLTDDPRSAKTQKQLWALAEEILPRRRVGDFNQALMEIGSQVCFPLNPDCPRCPLRRNCLAAEQGIVHRIPKITPRVESTDVFQFAIAIWRGNKCLLRKCGPGQRWEGLWDVPRFDLVDHRRATDLPRLIESQTGLIVEVSPRRFTLRHSVTRYKLEMSCHESLRVRGRLRKPPDHAWAWVTDTALNELPLNVSARRMFTRLRASERTDQDQ